MFIENNKKYTDLIIYFHGNAEDANYSYNLIDYISDEIKAHAIIMEYPSYGVYKGLLPKEEIIY